MDHVARILGQLLLAVGGLWLFACAGLALHGDRTAAMMSAVLAVGFALPGWLLHSYSAVAGRRREAAELVRTRDRFTIDEVAQRLRSSPEVAHAFIAGQIATQGLELAYQQDIKGYARRGLPSPPAAPPCPSCGSTAPRTETGFCPSCGARG